MGKLQTIREESTRIMTVHHFTNILLVSSFYASKTIKPLCIMLYKGKISCHIDSREHEILLFLIVIIFWKNRKAATWLHVLSNFFMYTKLANLLLFYRLSPVAALLYGGFCTVQMVLFPEPAYSGAANFTYFRGPNLNEELQNNKKTTWFIEFYVAWSPECRQVTPVFAKISEKYSLANLKFGKLDVGRYTDEAEHFRINVHPTSRQLPTFSLFQNGKEVKRVPAVDKNGRAVRYVFSEVIS